MSSHEYVGSEGISGDWVRTGRVGYSIESVECILRGVAVPSLLRIAGDGLSLAVLSTKASKASNRSRILLPSLESDSVERS